MFDLLTPEALARAVENGAIDYQVLIAIMNKQTEGESK
jgi:hypothetical protein